MADSSDEDDPNRFDDAEDDMDIGDVAHVHAEPVQPVQPAVRGKPMAVAASLAAANRERIKQELASSYPHYDDAVDVVAEPVYATPVGNNNNKKRDPPSMDAHATPVHDNDTMGEAKPPPKKKQKKAAPKKSPASGDGGGGGGSKKKKKSTGGTPASDLLLGPTLDDPVDPMTEAEYQNLIRLMEHFCRVPLLAEFSRPVTLLHPELVAAYSKIVSHPIDLGRVCRKIRRREYQNTRQVQLDMWRIFSNCVKYHSHPSNKEAVPSFVSISLHLREFFEALWQEHMLPSDPPPKASGHSKTVEARYLHEIYSRREEDRKKRLIISGLTCLSQKCIKRSSDKLAAFLQNQGKLDGIDKDVLFPGPGEKAGPGIDEDDRKDLQLVYEKLMAYKDRLAQLVEDGTEYTVEQFDEDIRQCYTVDVFENNPALRFRVRNRINRFVGKILVPVNEANCRGVTQSSIWGCMAAAIWARESSKKPFWPALVLGILAPDDQKEDWHWALTERNELRLPETLRTQLSAGKRKAELALRRQSQGHADPQSFFLVEFLGTHEFIWVRETDIVESFEPEDDPNLKMAASKKKKSARTSSASVVGTQKYQTAVEEAKWALEEFEIQLQDACGEMAADDDDQEAEDGNYSYTVLCVSDEEADDAYSEEKKMTADDIEEANELIATRGLIDFSATGRKNAKKRAQALKKQQQEAQKKEKLEKQKKQKAEQSKKKRKESASSKVKEREDKKEQKELEKRRKKRSREREKAMKMTKKAQAPKRRRVSTDKEDQRKSISGENLVLDKRARATAIVNGYLTRMAKDDEYKSLGLAGIMSIPAAMVDSSGLLGMSLAFRAAAGELTMPEESGDQDQKKPWEAIDVDSPNTTKERTDRLRKQVELLEDEIKRVKSATEMRLKWALEAETAREKLDRDIAKDELAARVNPFKKKKKIPDSTTKSVDHSPAGKSEQGHDEYMKDAYGTDETPSKEATNEADSMAPTPSSFSGIASEEKMAE